MKKSLLFMAFAFTQLSIAQDDPCIVTIPDANFKDALLNYNPVIDTNGDGEIQCDEASTYTGSLYLDSTDISSLTGIEAFTALTKLYCSDNPLTNLDLSSNTSLQELSCQYTQLTVLDVSLNTELKTLFCSNNSLTSLNLSSNTALEFLYCSNTELTSLDVSSNTALTYLNCGNNNLTSLDVSTNVVLQRLFCFNNQLTSLDVSANTELWFLHCIDNQLLSLNIANGNNTIIQGVNAINNPDLTCIQVDSADYSNTNWIDEEFFKKPEGAVWSESCSMSISDFETFKVTAYPNPTNGIINLSEIANITVFDIQGRKITESKNVTSFDLSSQTTGIYFVQIATEKGTETIKIIKK